MTDVKSGEKAVSGVLPNSMVQRIVIWIALLALLLVALMIAGWVATSGLDDSWWSFLVVGPLVFVIVFLDQTSMEPPPLLPAEAGQCVRRSSGDCRRQRQRAARPEQGRGRGPQRAPTSPPISARTGSGDPAGLDRHSQRPPT